MRYIKILLAISFLVFSGTIALADGYDLAYKNLSEFPVYTGAAASGDKTFMFDASANKVVYQDATALNLTGAFNGTIGATTPSTGVFTTMEGSIGSVTPAAGVFTSLQANTSLKVNATSGTSITAIRFAFDAVASGQTAKTTALTGVTATSRCTATFAEVATNAISMRAAVPGTDEVVITVSGDPGASNQDYTVLCLN